MSWLIIMYFTHNFLYFLESHLAVHTHGRQKGRAFLLSFIFTITVPISFCSENVICFLCLLHIFKQTPDYFLLSLESSLNLVHIVCNIGCQSYQADDKADDICREWQENG